MKKKHILTDASIRGFKSKLTDILLRYSGRKYIKSVELKLHELIATQVEIYVFIWTGNLKNKTPSFSIIHFKTPQRTFFKGRSQNAVGCVYFIIDSVFVKNHSFHGPKSYCLSQAIEFGEIGDIEVGGQDSNVMKLVLKTHLQKCITRAVSDCLIRPDASISECLVS